MSEECWSHKELRSSNDGSVILSGRTGTGPAAGEAGAMEETMNAYTIKDTGSIITPALVFYKDLIVKNTERAIEIAGGAEKLWPHIKTHKSADMLRLQMEYGIRRFKCATIAELETAASVGAEAAVLAMAPVGPTPDRLLAVKAAYPDVHIYGIADCPVHLEMYEAAAAKASVTVDLLIDVNMGMDRTGISLEQVSGLYTAAAALPHVHIAGMHCYDGDRHEADLAVRQAKVNAADEVVGRTRREILEKGFDAGIMIFGGTPSFPCQASYWKQHGTEGIWYSPGTIFVGDKGFSDLCPELDMIPGAAILCRVLSHPAEGLFTVDVGTKGIASEMPLQERGRIAGLDHYHFVSQSEEHLVFEMEPGHENEAPAQGTEVYFIPHHICPCTVLYPEVLIAERRTDTQSGWTITDTWPVSARNRRITF